MSSSDRIRLLKAQTLARFHKLTPKTPDMANRGQSAEILLLRQVGTENDCGVCCEPVCDLSGTLAFPMSNNPINSFYYLTTQAYFNNEGVPIVIPAPPPGYPTDDSLYGFFIFGPSVCNATDYTINITDVDGIVQSDIYNLGEYSIPGLPYSDNTVILALWTLRPFDYNSLVVQVVASNACSSSSDDAEFGCFLEGSQVCMHDGTTKPIEKVLVGDKVRGAFGEINTVEALHRPILGAGSMVVINGEHTTTAHHPHISKDRNFYVAEPEIIAGFTYGKKHTVILADGTKEKRVMLGVDKTRLLKLITGIELQTITGGRIVNTIEYKPMSPMTQVYHLVVGGSHTYNVEGYAVSAWPNESDFNYDTWSAK